MQHNFSWINYDWKNLYKKRWDIILCSSQSYSPPARFITSLDRSWINLWGSLFFCCLLLAHQKCVPLMEINGEEPLPAAPQPGHKPCVTTTTTTTVQFGRRNDDDDDDYDYQNHFRPIKRIIHHDFFSISIFNSNNMGSARFSTILLLLLLLFCTPIYSCCRRSVWFIGFVRAAVALRAANDIVVVVAHLNVCL